MLKVSRVHLLSIAYFYQSSPNEWPACTRLPKLHSLRSLSLLIKCERTSDRKNQEGEMISLIFPFFKKI